MMGAVKKDNYASSAKIKTLGQHFNEFTTWCFQTCHLKYLQNYHYIQDISYFARAHLETIQDWHFALNATNDSSFLHSLKDSEGELLNGTRALPKYFTQLIIFYVNLSWPTWCYYQRDMRGGFMEIMNIWKSWFRLRYQNVRSLDCRTIWHRTIWHRTIWHQDNKADNLAPR